VQSAFFFLVLAIGIADIALSNRIGLAPLALFYAALKIQADLAAARFLRELRLPLVEAIRKPWQKPESTRKRLAPLISLEEAQRRREKARQRKAAMNQTQEQTDSRQARPIQPYESPKFSGRPHEVLGIEEDAATGRIVRAFRHWIKHHHPDHAGQSATDRARQLTSARATLLERRKRLRA
jgi:predicted PhzF superfamily epimerase YddE/YHI9